MNDKLTEFLSTQDVCNNYGSGRGYDSGYGYGDGNGYGDGDGSGRGYGRGDGDGDVSGSGYGYGDGSSGYSDGNGNGRGYGNGRGLLKINGMTVHNVDGIPTMITHVSGDIATGFTLFKNVYPKRCYVAKCNGFFAHGETAREAMEEARRKSLENLQPESRIRLFINKFGGKDKIPAKELFFWHGTLTGSCRFGREMFCEEHGIDIQNDYFTIDEFIQLTRDSYGKNVILELEKCLHKLK